jgi:hypothetical protein
VASLIASTRAVKRVYKDGDQHPVFRQTAYATVRGGDGVDVAAVAAPSSVPSLISRPEAVEHGPVDVPHEKTKGLSRAQLIARAEQFKAEETAAASAPAVAAAPAKAEVAKTTVTATPAKIVPMNAKAVAAAPPPAAPATQATAFTATESKKDDGGIFSRLTGKLGSLTASSSDAASEVVATPQPSALPTPPKR